MDDGRRRRDILLMRRIGWHIDGFVDSYCGPPELTERVGGDEPAPPAALADEGRGLAGAIAGALGDARRERWLAAQVEGLTAAAERLAGIVHVEGRSVDEPRDFARC